MKKTKLFETKRMMVGALLLAFCTCIWARNIDVKGRVVDRFTGEPYIGVGVYAKFDNRADSAMAVSDASGWFKVSVPENQQLLFTYVGFKNLSTVAEEFVLVELEEGMDPLKNPLWIVDGSKADVDYPNIWLESPFGDISLDMLVCQAIPVLSNHDIAKIDLKHEKRQNDGYYGLCRVNTNPTTIQIVVNGESRNVIKEQPGKLAGKTGALKYASNTLKIDSVVDAIAIDCEKILHNAPAGAKKMLAVMTNGHYPTVSESGFKQYQYFNGYDTASDGVYRIVDRDGKIGYATENNTVIIPPRFAFGYPFNNGCAKVTDSGHPEELEGSDGRCHNWISDNWYWIDKLGNIINR